MTRTNKQSGYVLLPLLVLGGLSLLWIQWMTLTLQDQQHLQQQRQVADLLSQQQRQIQRHLEQLAEEPTQLSPWVVDAEELADPWACKNQPPLETLLPPLETRSIQGCLQLVEQTQAWVGWVQLEHSPSGLLSHRTVHLARMDAP